MGWDGTRQDRQGHQGSMAERSLCAELGSHLRMQPHTPCSRPARVQADSPFPNCSQQVPEPRKRERTTLQEAGTGPKQSVSNFLLCGWWHTSPASPHTSHQPSTRPHSLLVCVVKSSQYSSPESVNSSVPCLLPLPKGCQVCCPLPQRVNLPSCLTLSPGK